MNKYESAYCVNIYIAIKKKYIEYKILAVTDFKVSEDTNIIWNTDEYIDSRQESNDVETDVCEQISELEDMGFNTFKLVLRNIFTNELVYPVFYSSNWN